MPELSVILATINDSIACNLTCASILAQLEDDDIDYEIILLDNNSLPEEKLILQQFLRYHKDFPIKYFNFDVTGTIPIHAFGVEQAQGKYITMPEPHIVLSPHYYKTLLTSLKELKAKNAEIVFSLFSTGTVVKRNEQYLGESVFIKHNPFAKATGGGGISYFKTDIAQPIFTGAFCGMICEKEWLLKIGNLFPDAFQKAGGYVAEAILLGLSTWMFGKKCYLESKARLDHPVYRIRKGPGRNEHMHYSMAVGAYIVGGDKYLDKMQIEFGPYLEETFRDIKQEAKAAREYVEKNAKYSLDELINNWEKIKNE